MNKAVTEYLTFLRHEKNASPHTIAAYESDLRQLEEYYK
jgi:site-specific recombinase XerD